MASHTAEKNINVAFFGTSDRSIPILNALKENFNLAICFTKTDSPVGRNKVLKETAVKTYWIVCRCFDTTGGRYRRLAGQ